ncbi:MAG: hypothetical protein ACT4PX_09325 [Actinomycetota bacterium]
MAVRDGTGRAGAGAGWLARVRSLDARPRVVGPHARLGVVWCVVWVAALTAGRWPLALLLAPCAGLAGVQAARTWRSRPRPAPPAAGAGAALLVLAAPAGPLAVGVAAAAVTAVVLAGAAMAGPRRADPVLTLVIAGSIGLAAASPVLLLRSGLVPVFVLLALVSVHDASVYVVGTGARSGWEGPAAGMASMAAVTLAVAAVLVPPFRGVTPWVLGGLAIALTPLGPYAGSALLGHQGARVPALRRLDSLLVVAPVWCLVAARILE